MKLNRLLEITILLMNRGSVTAGELAERFGVSTRTIYRDIDALSCAGVPVYMSKGKGGGISLLENYSLSKTFLSDEERESLLLALQTMGVTRYPETGTVLEKLGAIFQNPGRNDWVEIDFAGWGSSPNEKDKLHTIRTAILNRTLIEFDYINAQGIKSRRKVEPEKLYFSLNTWYLIGYCLMKQGTRVFRFSRIKNAAALDRTFVPRERVSGPMTRVDRFAKPFVRLKLLFTEAALYRLYDEFDESCIRKRSDGYEVNVAFPEDQWVYGFLLSFGPQLRVLEPERVRRILVGKMEEALQIYQTAFEYDTQLSQTGGIIGVSQQQEEPTMKIETTARAAQPVLCIRVRTSLSRLTAAFDEGYGKLAAYLAELGEAPVAGPYGAYYNDDMEHLDVEMGFPVSKELPGKGEIQFREIPAMEQAVTATHKGSYQSLDATYGLLYRHIAENKLAMTGPHFDFYLNDPSVTPEAELITQVVLPVSAEPMVFCQSCGMPLGQEEQFGTEKDGGKSEDYCVYCYKDGAFLADVTMGEMIGISLTHMQQMRGNDPSFDANEALTGMRNFFPMLKRWKTK